MHWVLPEDFLLALEAAIPAEEALHLGAQEAQEQGLGRQKQDWGLPWPALGSCLGLWHFWVLLVIGCCKPSLTRKGPPGLGCPDYN